MNKANSYCREMDKALEARPPVIVWRKDARGILVAVSIDDPHTQVASPEPIYNPPEQVEPEETSLLAAARTEL
jgi:hypothetical protein